MAVVALMVACGCMPGSAQAKAKPNIIVIQTDDQSADMITKGVMPDTARLLRGHGTTFTDYIDSGPLCCPSRAVLLTGQYGHNNGVMWNHPNPYGDLRGKHNTLPVWLKRAGYVTAHVGKFLNLYERAVDNPNEVPPGWDEWHTMLEPLGYYGYTLRENGHAVKYGYQPKDYLTRVINKKAVHLIRRYVPRRKPLFMEVDQFAPHNSVSSLVPQCAHSGIPDPRDVDLFSHARLPMPPSFNEADVSDKPSYIQAQPRFSEAGIEDQRRQYRCRLASLRAVDRGVRNMVHALRSAHELRDTAFIFTSDNGWLQGEHRAAGEKVAPYEEALHVPFVVRLPGQMRGGHRQPRRLASTVANIDVAPTIARMAHAKPCSRPRNCRTLDGRSMLRAVTSDGRRWPRHRAILLELRAPDQRAYAYSPCDYRGVRTTNQVYVEYRSYTLGSNGACIQNTEFEHYDLRADPFELNNLFPAPSGSPEAAKETSLAARLERLVDCAGVKGRDPKPASGHYCE